MFKRLSRQGEGMTVAQILRRLRRPTLHASSQGTPCEEAIASEEVNMMVEDGVGDTQDDGDEQLEIVGGPDTGVEESEGHADDNEDARSDDSFIGNVHQEPDDPVLRRKRARALRREEKRRQRSFRFEVADAKAAKTESERELILGLATMTAAEQQRFAELVRATPKPDKVVGASSNIVGGRAPARQLLGSSRASEDLDDVAFMFHGRRSGSGIGRIPGVLRSVSSRGAEGEVSELGADDDLIAKPGARLHYTDRAERGED
jgi:hypothetical protein